MIARDPRILINLECNSEILIPNFYRGACFSVQRKLVKIRTRFKIIFCESRSWVSILCQIHVTDFSSSTHHHELKRRVGLHDVPDLFKRNPRDAGKEHCKRVERVQQNEAEPDAHDQQLVSCCFFHVGHGHHIMSSMVMRPREMPMTMSMAHPDFSVNGRMKRPKSVSSFLGSS